MHCRFRTALGADVQVERRPVMRARSRRLLGLLVLVCGVLLALAAQSSAALAASWGTGIKASLPANAGSNAYVSVNTVSCASAGNCSAVGNYGDSSGRRLGLLLTETAGRWATGVQADLPANAGSSPGVSVDSVSCASPGNCAAVGDYYDSSNNNQGLLLNQSAGRWGRGVEATLPAGAAANPQVIVGQVSCPSAGNCSAVGRYYDSSGHSQGLLLTETGGTWAPGAAAMLPANAGADPRAFVGSVSCASAGNCSAVGTYYDTSGDAQGLLIRETAGTWAPGTQATLPGNADADPNVLLEDVSCASAGNCSAVGYYTGSGQRLGLLLRETAGTWAAGDEATLPANAGSDPAADVSSVSCASAGNCSAVGEYADNLSHWHGLLLTETAGTWAPGVDATLPANVGSNSGLVLGPVSCGSPGDCDAVGYYTDTAGNTQGLLLSQTAGRWGKGIEAPLPAGAALNPHVLLGSVSCASAGNCSAVGWYTDSAGNRQGVLLATVRGLTVSKAGPGHGAVTSSPAGINCGSSCSADFANGAVVTLTATPARDSAFAGWSGACSGRGACRVGMTADRSVTARFAHLPGTKITEASIDNANHRAKFEFRPLGKATGFQCALVKKQKGAGKHKKAKPHFSSCHSRKAYKGLAPGRYTFLVRAVNQGAHDPTPAKKSFGIGAASRRVQTGGGTLDVIQASRSR